MNGVFGQQSISEVKALPYGSVVTTTGTISCGNEFGEIRYMQDNIAGIALYDNDLSLTKEGDSILVTGVLSKYREQVQIFPVFSFSVVGNGKELDLPVFDNIEELSETTFESRKVIFSCAGVSSCKSIFREGAYTMFDQSGSISRLWISETLEDMEIPVKQGSYIIEGIWTKFEDQYELRAQTVLDASEGSCHFLLPARIFFISGDVILSWNNLPSAQTNVLIGENQFDMDFDIGWLENTLDFSPGTLTSGTVYHGVIRQEDAGGEIYQSIPAYFALPSVSKPIEILFNRSINTSFSDGSSPLGTGSSVIESDLIDRIDQVRETLDIAMYNTSKTSIVQAVNRAALRGVVVRYIADDGTSNSALDGLQEFPIQYRQGNGIMHNKFVIGDADDSEKGWLWSGSTNFSTNQLSTDPNHAYIIHDQSLALNYRKEFEEMWGSLPDQPQVRIGDYKVDNTAHVFMSNNALFESYFSPSDETACHIRDALRSADYQVQIGLLLLTHFELIDEIIALHQAEVDVRVILEDEDSSGNALNLLRQANVPVVVHDPNPIFHHKYAIIDEGYPDSDPQVVTGSHNWTWSADNINDENTLIIHDQSVANIFRQEFEARWEELNPTSIFELSDDPIRIIPNPASSYVKIQLHEPCQGLLELIDIRGHVLLSQELNGQESTILDIRGQMPAGYYIVRVSTSDNMWTGRLIVF